VDKDKTNKSLLLNFGPREVEIFNFIKDLNENTTASDNRNEIIRRGLNSFPYLIQANEDLFLNELSINLKLLYENFEWERFLFVKNLALLSYTIMICKKGISESENFETIILSINSIEDYKKKYSLDYEGKRLIKEMLDYISKSIDLVFLKKSMELNSKLALNSYYFDKSTADYIKLKRYDIYNDIESWWNIFSAKSSFVTKVKDEKVLGEKGEGEEIETTTSSTIFSKGRLINELFE
jgi:hypothetical protein